jgi:hypothetical protein
VSQSGRQAKTTPVSNEAIHQLFLATWIQCGRSKCSQGSLGHKGAGVIGIRTPTPSPPDCPLGR